MFIAYLLLGVALLGAVLLLARWFVNAEPATLVVVAKWVGGTIAVFLAIYLIVSGRAGAALGLAGAAFVLLRAMGRLRRMGSTRPSPGASSDVESAYLRMTLDHDSGAMEGTVLQGPFSGRELSDLSLDELLSLLAECARADRQPKGHPPQRAGPLAPAGQPSLALPAALSHRRERPHAVQGPWPWPLPAPT